MASSTRLRSTPAWLAAAVVAALVPLAGPAAPAFAVECTTEVAPTMDPLPIPTGPGCDDTTPPETTIDSVSPEPNAQGWIRQDSVTFTFSGAHIDEDQDTIAFECQFFVTSAAPAQWDACTSPASYDELDETTTTPFTFRVRAVDTADDRIDLTTDPFFPQETDQPDVDQTPAERTVKVDTVAPVALIFEGPYDKDGTGWPITKQPKASFLLGPSEDDVTYRCLLDGQQVACDEGPLVLKGLAGGNRTLAVTVTDRAGNRDDSPATKQFVVPHNLTRSDDWSRKKGQGYFARDFLQARHFGAELTFRARLATDILLVAPSGPTLGKIQVRLGNQAWRTLRLTSKKTSQQRRYLVRDDRSLFSGPIRIRSISRSKPVRVDALVFPPS